MVHNLVLYLEIIFVSIICQSTTLQNQAVSPPARLIQSDYLHVSGRDLPFPNL
jgi:hypothetical protein